MASYYYTVRTVSFFLLWLSGSQQICQFILYIILRPWAHCQLSDFSDIYAHWLTGSCAGKTCGGLIPPVLIAALIGTADFPHILIELLVAFRDLLVDLLLQLLLGVLILNG
jgi:hypothetical protein